GRMSADAMDSAQARAVLEKRACPVRAHAGDHRAVGKRLEGRLRREGQPPYGPELLLRKRNRPSGAAAGPGALTLVRRVEAQTLGHECSIIVMPITGPLAEGPAEPPGSPEMGPSPAAR